MFQGVTEHMGRKGRPTIQVCDSLASPHWSLAPGEPFRGLGSGPPQRAWKRMGLSGSASGAEYLASSCLPGLAQASVLSALTHTQLLPVRPWP